MQLTSQGYTNGSSSLKGSTPAVLTLVRHGTTNRNTAFDAIGTKPEAWRKLASAGDDDTVLNKDGYWQARYTGRAMASERFDACVTSPSMRAMQTAQLIIGELEVRPPLLVDSRLKEISHGLFRRYNDDTYREAHPEEAERKRALGEYFYKPPGGESYAEKLERDVRPFIQGLRRFGGGTVLVVSHSIVIKLLKQELAGLGADGFKSIPRSPNCAVTRYAGGSAELSPIAEDLVGYPESFVRAKDRGKVRLVETLEAIVR